MFKERIYKTFSKLLQTLLEVLYIYTILGNSPIFFQRGYYLVFLLYFTMEFSGPYTMEFILPLRRFKDVYPCVIKSWQSDNGAENLEEFDEQLKRDGIPHYFSYPRCPKINTYIERYNRTIEEEFIDNNLDIIYDKPLFNKRLADYLVFYNTQRPHKSLGLKSPIEYLIENGGMSQKSLTYKII